MKNTYRGLFAANTLGLNRTLVGMAVTIFLLVGALAGPPVGDVIDRARKRLKLWLVISLVARFVLYVSFDWVTDKFGYYFVSAIDGIIFCFTQAIAPALLAITIDRRAMGTGYAVMMGVQNVATASANSVGVQMFNSYGVLGAGLLAGGLGLVAAVLTLFMDGKKIAEAPAEPNRGKRAKFGICTSMVPLCLVAACAVALNQFSRNYMVIYGEEFAINYLPYMTMGYTISGILNVAIGFLCDFINPFVLIMISFVIMVPIPLGWAAGDTNPMLFNIATLLIAPMGYNQTCLRILGMKAVAKADQGSFQGTFLLFNQVLAMVFGQAIGIGLDVIGYHGTMYVLAAWGVGILVLFGIYYYASLRKLIQANLAAPAEEPAPPEKT